MQKFGVTNKEHYDMLWYFLEWSIGVDALALKFRVFIAQLVEHYSANLEAMSSNPVKPPIFFRLNLHLFKIAITQRRSYVYSIKFSKLLFKVKSHHLF